MNGSTTAWRRDTAALVLDARAERQVPDARGRQILASIGARAVAIKTAPAPAAGGGRHADQDRPESTSHMSVASRFVDASGVLAAATSDSASSSAPGSGHHRIGGRREAAALRHVPASRATCCAVAGDGDHHSGLIYFALHHLFVRRCGASPRTWWRSMRSGKHRAHPRALRRTDEIGVAERELADMQRTWCRC